METMEMWDNMRITKKVRYGERRRTIAVAEMRDHGDTGDIDTGKWRRWQRRRCGTGNRRDAETTDIVVFGRLLRWA